MEIVKQQASGYDAANCAQVSITRTVNKDGGNIITVSDQTGRTLYRQDYTITQAAKAAFTRQAKKYATA